MRLLLDTNIINYILRQRASIIARFTEAIRAPATFLSSEVVDYEIRRYLLLKGATRQLKSYEALSHDWEKLTLTRSDWQVAAQRWADLHRQGLSIEDRDLLIGVSALKGGATLVTNNPRHFEHLGVPLVNWATEA